MFINELDRLYIYIIAYRLHEFSRPQTAVSPPTCWWSTSRGSSALDEYSRHPQSHPQSFLIFFDIRTGSILHKTVTYCGTHQTLFFSGTSCLLIFVWPYYMNTWYRVCSFVLLALKNLKPCLESQVTFFSRGRSPVPSF